MTIDNPFSVGAFIFHATMIDTKVYDKISKKKSFANFP